MLLIFLQEYNILWSNWAGKKFKKCIFLILWSFIHRKKTRQERKWHIAVWRSLTEKLFCLGLQTMTLWNWYALKKLKYKKGFSQVLVFDIFEINKSENYFLILRPFIHRSKKYIECGFTLKHVRDIIRTYS